MKKILILVSKKNFSAKKLHNYLKKNLNQIAEVFLVELQELSFFVEQGDVKIKFGTFLLSDFDLVYFRSGSGHFNSIEKGVSVFLEYKKINFFDSYLKDGSYAGNKLSAITRLALNDLPIIPTFFCKKDHIYKYMDVINKKFGFPLVIKTLTTQRGEGVFLIKRMNDLREVIESHPGDELIFQKYCHRDTEYRLLVLGGKVAVAEKKIQNDPREFRANVARGAIEEFVDPKKVSINLRRIAVKAAKILKIDIAGVDIMIDKSGTAWLLEVNRGPGFTYDKISPELPELAKYFEKMI